jgi:L-ascorbate metabolism protein UlaG (beta-lactamase superfamily)
MRIHYLGHASFVLRLEYGESILLDYGVSNAYGLASPIFDISGSEPTIVAYSHDHPDHRRPGLSFPNSRILAGGGALTLDGLSIRSIGTSESSMEAADNASFLITYRGFRILHLADAQAFISAIDDPVVKRRVKARYPDRYDLVFMTIDGPSEMTAQAATFLELLAPARAIPMHYRSPEIKADFLAELVRLNRTARGGTDRFTIAETGCSDFSLYADSPPRGTRVISLEPSPLYLSPGAGVPLDGASAATEPPAESPAEPCAAVAPEAVLAVPPGRVPAAGFSQRPRHVAAPAPMHRPAAAASSPGPGPLLSGPIPVRRPAPAPSPSRMDPRVTAHGGRDLG